MKKGLGIILIFLITGCFGNANLEQAILNTKNAESFKVELDITYYETEFVDYHQRNYQAIEEFELSRNRMKTFDVQSESYVYYQIINDEMGFLYREEAGEWVESQIPISVRDYSKEAMAEINFLANEDLDFSRGILNRNHYQKKVKPKDFFTVTNDFYEVEGEVTLEITVSGDFIDQINYQLETNDEKVFSINMRFFDYNETVITFPTESGSYLGMDDFKEVAMNLEEIVLKQYQNKNIQGEELFLFRDGQLTDDSPNLDYTGFMPTRGVVIINEAKEVRLALHANNYCVTKKIGGNVQVQEVPLADCRLP